MSGDPVILQAITTVRGRYTLAEWAALMPREITAEIYREIRRLDRVRVECHAAERRAVAEAAVGPGRAAERIAIEVRA